MVNEAGTDPQRLIDVGEIATAQQELNKANGSGMLKYLKKAGGWVSDVAAKHGPTILQVIEMLSRQ